MFEYLLWPRKLSWVYIIHKVLCRITSVKNQFLLNTTWKVHIVTPLNIIHPGLAEIPAPVGSQEVVYTPTNAHCSLVNACLGAGRVLQLVQDGSHLINVMICIDISRVVWVTRACMVGGMYWQKRLHVWCLLESLYCIKFKEFLTQKLQGPVLHIGLWKCGTRPALSYCVEG